MSDLTLQQSPDSSSPFDEIRRTRADGSEYWSARELMPLMGYSTWRNFLVPIARAMRTAENQGQDRDSHFARSHKMVERPQGGGAEQEDFELSRFAAYLAAMNGDPNKPEVAAAQAYFAVRTREAETAPALPDISTPSGVLAMTEMFHDTAKQLVAATEQNQMMAAQIRNDAPKVAKAEAHTASTSSIHRQGFAREVQAWGIKTGVKINHEQVYAFLRHKGMLIDGDRSDRNHATSTAVKNGWAWTEKGTTENGRDYFVTRLYPKGQDIAWKWITGFIDANGHLELPRRIGAAS